MTIATYTSILPAANCLSTRALFMAWRWDDISLTSNPPASFSSQNSLQYSNTSQLRGCHKSSKSHQNCVLFIFKHHPPPNVVYDMINCWHSQIICRTVCMQYIYTSGVEMRDFSSIHAQSQKRVCPDILRLSVTDQGIGSKNKKR